MRNQKDERFDVLFGYFRLLSERLGVTDGGPRRLPHSSPRLAPRNFTVARRGNNGLMGQGCGGGGVRRGGVRRGRVMGRGG